MKLTVYVEKYNVTYFDLNIFVYSFYCLFCVVVINILCEYEDNKVS